MSDYKDRVRVEQAELADRHAKLTAFLDTPVFEALPLVERADLFRQHNAMSDYLTAQK